LIVIQKPVSKAYAAAKAQQAIGRSIAAALSWATRAGAAGCHKFVPRHKINRAFRYLRERLD
jgi:hypothetical protein